MASKMFLGTFGSFEKKDEKLLLVSSHHPLAACRSTLVNPTHLHYGATTSIQGCKNEWSLK